MSEAYKIHKQDGVYFVTFQVVYWIDIFTRKRYCDIFIESLNYRIQHRGLVVYAYVIMSNHVHLILSAENKDLSKLIGSLKSTTSKRIIESICIEKESRREWMLEKFQQARLAHQRNSNYQIWTHENHALECFSPEFTTTRVNYIHENPVRAGIVESAEEFLYSSARNYFGKKGLIPVVILHPHFAFS